MALRFGLTLPAVPGAAVAAAGASALSGLLAAVEAFGW